MERRPDTHHWLTAKRLVVYPRILVVLLALAFVFVPGRSKQRIDLNGGPLGNDFITFWAASAAALHGHAADAYDAARILPYERLAVPACTHVFGWFYPPSFFLLISPMALMPYLVAYALFMTATVSLYVVVLRRIVRGSTAMWCLAAFSGLWINIMDGQNGLLTALLAGAGILCLNRRPWLAGVVIGLLAIKPHLALLFPIALLAIGAWRTIAAAAATAFAFTAAGVAVLGHGTFKAWLASLRLATLLLREGGLPWEKMPTVFAMARMSHLPLGVADTLQGIVAIAATCAIWRVWRGSPEWPVRGAALMSATFLISPYVFDYDLAWLAFPIAWLAVTGGQQGWQRGERETLIAAWILPLVSTPIASATHIEVAPFVAFSLLWLTLRRATGISRPISYQQLAPAIAWFAPGS